MKKLHKQLNHVRLTKQESADMRGEMLSYMKEHPAAVSPVRKSDPIRHSMGIGKHFPIRLLVTHNRMFAGILLAIVAALSGGTVFAAQGALPGDMLYPIKVNVNEEVRGAFTLNTEAKVAWETTLAERRSHEAATLVTEGTLDEDVAADLSARLATHLDKAESLMAELEAKGNLEAAANAQSRLEALLNVQQRIFQSLEDDATADTEDNTTTSTTTTTTSTDTDDEDDDTNDDNRKNVSSITHILDALEHKADVQERVRADYADKLEEKDEDDRARTLAQTKQVTETKIATTEKILLAFEEKNGARTEAHAAFDAAVTMKQEADRKLLAKEYGDAFELYHKAQTMLDRVHLFLRTSAAIGIDLQIDTDRDDDGDDDRNRSDEKREDVNDEDTDDEQNADDADEKEDEEKNDDDTDEDDALNIEIETDALLDIDDKETRSESKSRVNIGL